MYEVSRVLRALGYDAYDVAGFARRLGCGSEFSILDVGFEALSEALLLFWHIFIVIEDLNVVVEEKRCCGSFGSLGGVAVAGMFVLHFDRALS